MEESILKSEQIYDGKLVKLHRVEVQLPDGERSLRELVRHPGAVAIVAIDRDRRVLLVRQFRIAAERVLYELPAGTLEDSEQPELAAVRELREETGYRPEKLEAIGGLYVAPGYTTEFIHLFLAQSLVLDPLDGDVDEFIEPVWMTYAQALELIEQGEIQDGKTQIGLLRVARRLGL